MSGDEVTGRKTPTGSIRTPKQRVGAWIMPALRPWRLMLALKVAIAATAAWFLGSLLPGEIGDFSYYAPLGALVSLTPTLMDSVRSSLQTLVGLGLGIGLAWLLIISPAPGWVSVSLSVGLGTLLAGLPGLGQGRDYVPIAALFVIIIGGANANDFSVGYLVQMALGVLVGLLVNLLIMPPLFVRESAAGISAARSRMVGALRSMSDTLRSESAPTPDDPPSWDSSLLAIRHDVDAARGLMKDAAESRRANPRTRWNRHDFRGDEGALAALERIAPVVVEIGDALRAALWGIPVPVDLDEGVRSALADAIDASADLVEAAIDDERLSEALRASDRALTMLRRAVRSAHAGANGAAGREPDDDDPAEDAGGENLLFALRRIHAEIERSERSPEA
ncbi:FUSC family protein [Plantibacter sp. MCCC 1A11337]|uniref:FUSC family protein n=1 Tax=Plantibacter sp. MCCC 1A11337 TaxID=2736644 RepID=UPI001582B269|nr:FUSC family protein [Plantibacter sp. MCCC 1A11337]NUJ88578.1 FUSC family protein [Plantibacter sp. MCCC 1A11337]